MKNRRHHRPTWSPVVFAGTRWLGWGLLLAGLLVLAGWGVVTAINLLDHARSLQSHLQQLEGFAGASSLELADLEGAGSHLAGIRHDLEAINVRVRPFLPAGRLLRWVPTYGGDLAASSDLLGVALGVASAGDSAFRALSPALDLAGESDGSASSALALGQQVLPVLVAAQPSLRAAQQDLVAVRGARVGIDIASLSPRVAGYLSRLDRYLPWFETAVDGALVAPEFLGGNGPRTYLVLAQNNHELRPTGGFISGVGELRIEDGRLASLTFSDSYAVDNLEVPHDLTPADFQDTLSGQLWFFRDANWDADFPTSARRALDIYARDRGVQADGVIALDLTALQLLVDAVGPLQVAGIEGPVTGQDVVQVIQDQWGGPVSGRWKEWWLHRKDFMGEIAVAAMNRLSSAGGIQPARLAQALRLALDEKHLLVYISDPQAGRLLRGRNWDGALPDAWSSSDLLLVVDTNVGFNKVDPNIERSIDYQVDLGAEGGPRARLALTYTNRSHREVQVCIQEARYGDSYADMMDRCYWNYLRVYVPAGSQLLAGPGLPLPEGSLLARGSGDQSHESVSPAETEGSWGVWTSFFDLAPGAERTLTFEYQLPSWVLDPMPGGLTRYRLRVQERARHGGGTASTQGASATRRSFTGSFARRPAAGIHGPEEGSGFYDPLWELGLRKVKKNPHGFLL